MSKTGGFFGFTAAMYNLKDFSDINRNIGFEGGNEVMKAHYEMLSGSLLTFPANT